MSLDISKWKEFRIGDLFKLQRGHTLTSEQKEEFIGSIPCINGTIANNGVQCKLSKEIESVGFKLIKAPAISIVRVGNGGKTFVQTEDFYIADNAFALISLNNISIYSMMFVSTLLDAEQIKYSYGRTVTNLYVDTIIKLPVDSKGNPDWKYMENYIKSLHFKPLTTQNNKNQTPVLNINTWKTFSIGRLFTMLNGKGITQEEISENEGDFIAVQSGEENNGVMGKIDLNYCKQMKYTYTEKPCLTVARSGSAGFVSYQHDGCVVGDSAKILLLPDEVATTEHYLFIQTLLTANRFKYTYGRKVTAEKYLNDVIDLPVQHNEDGSFLIDSSHKYSDEGYIPDWEFMENYIKSLPYGDRLVG